MSFTDGIDIGFNEAKRRRKSSAIPSFSGDLDIDRLSRGIPFGSSEDVGAQTRRNLLGQRGRLEQTPTRIKSEGNIQDAFLTNPLASPTIDSSRKSNGKRKNGQNKRDKGRANLVKVNRKLRRGGQPDNIFQTDTNANNWEGETHILRDTKYRETLKIDTKH